MSSSNLNLSCSLLTVYKGATLSAIPLKKVKFKVKNQEAKASYTNYQRFISK